MRFTLYRKALKNAKANMNKANMNSVFDLKLHNSKMLEYAANDIATKGRSGCCALLL